MITATKVLTSIRSGGAAINDAALHVPTLPFGGVGESGYGAYRGKASFDVWVHRRSITKSPGWVEFALNIRYPPYRNKLALFSIATGLTPDFDRNGRKLPFGILQNLLGKKGLGKGAVLATGE